MIINNPPVINTVETKYILQAGQLVKRYIAKTYPVLTKLDTKSIIDSDNAISDFV